MTEKELNDSKDKLALASTLQKKIAEAEKKYEQMAQFVFDPLSDKPDYFTIKTMATRQHPDKKIEFVIAWLEDKGLKERAYSILKATALSLMGLYQEDINHMKYELANL